MANIDVKVTYPGAGAIPTWTWQTAASATAIKAGDPIKLTSAGSPYALGFADDDLTRGTDSHFLGIAKSAATHTSTADGTIEVYMPLPGMIYECKATTAANVDTQSEINALIGDRITFDLTSTTYTLDENATDNVANAFTIIGGDPVNKTLKVIYNWVANAVDGN